VTSIRTNVAAMAALSASRIIDAKMARQRDAVSTGLRISEAAHNAAYWSISTTMKSDAAAHGAVRDALGLAAAKVDVAYAGMTQVVDLLGEVKARLVAAYENPGGAEAIQGEIRQMAAHARSIAGAASFGGVNWLSTDVGDLFDDEDPGRTASMASSFVRDSEGNVRVGHIELDLSKVSLFNSTGGGILQGDPRSPHTIGGVRLIDPAAGGYRDYNLKYGGRAIGYFDFDGPVDLSGGGAISFGLTVDADAPFLPGPLHPGSTSSVTIDEAFVNSVLAGANGVIGDFRDMISVLSAALSPRGLSVIQVTDWLGRVIPDKYAIMSKESLGLDGSSFAIAGLSTEAGGLRETVVHGTKGTEMTLAFSPFKVWDDVAITFDFSVNGSWQATKNAAITKDVVNSVLGRDDGRVDTAEEMAKLLEELIGMPGLEIAANGSTVTVRTDGTDRLMGARTRMGFSDVAVNIEPIPAVGLEDIDLVTNPDMVPAYLAAVEAMLYRATEGAATLGALGKRIEMQDGFISKLQDAISRGISQLVDADMEATSARLAALEVQRQLATQAMGIANASPKTILQLFRDA